MKPTEEADVIVEHAFENEQNLRITAKVGLAFSAVKKRIIREFIVTLVGSLKTRLGESWEIVDEWSKTPLGPDCYVAAYKTNWNVDAMIGLHCDKIGPSEMNLFVFLDKSQETNLVAELKQALDHRYAHGYRIAAQNPWWKWADVPYRDWNTEEALIRLWHKDEAAEYYVTRLLKICKIAGPYLDKICGL